MNTRQSASTHSVAPTLDNNHRRSLTALSRFLSHDHGRESRNAFTGRESESGSRSGSGGGGPERSGRAADGATAEAGAAAAAAFDAASAAALDNPQNSCLATPADESEGDSETGTARAVRSMARAALWRSSTLRSVRMCGNQVRERKEPDAAVGVRCRQREDGSMVAGFAGTYLCGSVWACPRCSAVIAQRRSEEMSRALRAARERGCEVYMVTLTVQHSVKDSLASLFEGLRSGWRAAFGTAAWTGTKARVRQRRGRLVEIPAVMGDSELFGVAGRIRVTETTRSVVAGGAGWHLHHHVLVITEPGGFAGAVRDDVDDVLAGWGYHGAPVDREALGMSAFGNRVFERWQRGARQAGFNATGAGFDIRKMHDGGEEAVASYLAKSRFDVSGRLAAEMSLGAQSKEARSERNLTPFEILDRCVTDLDVKGWGIRTPRHWTVERGEDDDLLLVDLDTGEVTAVTPPGLWRLWVEFEQASKGRRQMLWSRATGDSSRARLWQDILDARGEVDEDEDIAREELDGERLGEIPVASWRRLCKTPAWLTGALEAAEQGGVAAIQAYLGERGIEFIPTPPGDDPSCTPPPRARSRASSHPRN